MNKTKANEHLRLLILTSTHQYFVTYISIVLCSQEEIESRQAECNDAKGCQTVTLELDKFSTSLGLDWCLVQFFKTKPVMKDSHVRGRFKFYHPVEFKTNYRKLCFPVLICCTNLHNCVVRRFSYFTTHKVGDYFSLLHFPLNKHLM